MATGSTLRATGGTVAEFGRTGLWTTRGDGKPRSRLLRVTIDDRPIETNAQLSALWHQLMGGGGFGTRTLWLLFLDEERRPIKLIVPIEDLPLEPDGVTLEAIGRILDDVLGDHMSDPAGASVPMLLSRPGPLSMTDTDRVWAVEIRKCLARHLGPWPVHLATRNRIQVFAPDDLLAVGR